MRHIFYVALPVVIKTSFFQSMELRSCLGVKENAGVLEKRASTDFKPNYLNNENREGKGYLKF